jgi:beta-glucuronidase
MRFARTLLFIGCLVMAIAAEASTKPCIQNAGSRMVTSLNGKWNIIIDPYETGYYDYRYQPRDENPNPGADAFFTNSKPANSSERIEYDFDRSPTLLVPRDWNSQMESLLYYEGSIWYKKSFDYKKSSQSNRVFVQFSAANYRADVYLNGVKLGFHEGGFTPFEFEITSLVREKDNFLIVKMDNKRKREGVPTLNTDWWNYGGLTRDVRLVETPLVFIRDYFIRLKKESRTAIAIQVALDGNGVSGRSVRLEIPDLKIHQTFVTDDSGRCRADIPCSGLRLWSPEQPMLYTVTVKTDEDSISDLIGFRSIETRGQEILLNDKPIFLRGISIHEENPLRGGRACTPEDARLLLGWAKELNCNFVRLAHYPHNEYMARTADALGILVWEEIPVYWTIQWENEETYRNAANQLTELITRDKNRASVIIWSMANETPQSEARFSFLSRLNTLVRALDGSRLISAALERHGLPDDPRIQVIDDPFAGLADVLSFNEYIGWYDGLPTKCKTVKWQVPADKPVIVSEFGGDALAGLHGTRLDRWTEEFQEDLYQQTLAMLVQIPQLRGMTPWILSDFHSPRRVLPGIQDGWNRKGLVSETGERKQAFRVLQSFYQTIMSDPADFIKKLGETETESRR